MPRKNTVDVDIRDEIERLALREYGGAQIERELLRQADDARKTDPKSNMHKRIPSLRTIQNIVKEFRLNDPGGDWSVEHADPDDAVIVLDTLAALMLETKGQIRTVSSREAEWIVKVRRMYPDSLTPGRVLALYRLYSLRTVKGEPTADLDGYLAFHPWQSDESKQEYTMAIANGWAPQPPRILLIDLHWRDMMQEFAETVTGFVETRETEPDLTINEYWERKRASDE